MEREASGLGPSPASRRFRRGGTEGYSVWDFASKLVVLKTGVTLEALDALSYYLLRTLVWVVRVTSTSSSSSSAAFLLLLMAALGSALSALARSMAST